MRRDRWLVRVSFVSSNPFLGLKAACVNSSGFPGLTCPRPQGLSPSRFAMKQSRATARHASSMPERRGRLGMPWPSEYNSLLAKCGSHCRSQQLRSAVSSADPWAAVGKLQALSKHLLLRKLEHTGEDCTTWELSADLGELLIDLEQAQKQAEKRPYHTEQRDSFKDSCQNRFNRLTAAEVEEKSVRAGCQLGRWLHEGSWSEVVQKSTHEAWLGKIWQVWRSFSRAWFACIWRNRAEWEWIPHGENAPSTGATDAKEVFDESLQVFAIKTPPCSALPTPGSSFESHRFSAAGCLWVTTKVLRRRGAADCRLSIPARVHLADSKREKGTDDLDDAAKPHRDLRPEFDEPCQPLRPLTWMALETMFEELSRPCADAPWKKACLNDGFVKGSWSAKPTSSPARALRRWPVRKQSQLTNKEHWLMSCTLVSCRTCLCFKFQLLPWLPTEETFHQPPFLPNVRFHFLWKY